MGFLWYLTIRLGGAAATALAGAFFIFMIMQLAPGDPAITALGEMATDEAVAYFRARHGLDQPVLVQFWLWFTDLLHGDLGRSLSIAAGFPISELLWQRLPTTLFVSIYALVIALVVALIAGTVAAVWHGKTADTVATSFAVLGISMPDFWLSYVLILFFSLFLAWLPAYGFVQPTDSIAGAFRSGLLPAVAMGAPMAGVFTRILRSALLETKRREYVTAARSLGFKDAFVFVHYIFRNAIIPFVTVIGLQVRYLIGGVVIIERIFGIPGMGSLMVDGAFGRDYPLVQACALVFLVVVLSVNLMVDIICAMLDPRRTH